MRKKTILLTQLIIIGLLVAGTSDCKRDDQIVKRDDQIVKKDVTITWANPASITVGVLLSATQLNATADVTGTFVYTPTIGTILNFGNHNLRVDFTPTDAANYNIATKTVTINVTEIITIDGDVYHVVTIGTQVWMVENLKTTRYRDGSAIPNITDNTVWSKSTTGAYCNYNNTTNADTIDTYGRLYNGYAVTTGMLAPTGWHVPTFDEWGTLTYYLGGHRAGSKLKETGTTHWNSPNANATNETGFTALPGGQRYDGGTFNDIGQRGSWWCTTPMDFYYVWSWHMFCTSSEVTSHYAPRVMGYSVRCVRD